MCIKTIFHTTYADGERDRTETVETCQPGQMCADPEVREYDRRVGCTRVQLSSSPHRANSPLSLAHRVPSPYRSTLHHLRPPTPHSPGSPGVRSGNEHSDRERETRYRQVAPGVYLNDDKVVEVAGLGSRRRERRAATGRAVVDQAPRAPAPPAPITIPASRLRRSTTMPVAGATVVDAQPERRKPIIIENSNRHARRPSPAVDAIDIVAQSSSRAEPRYSSRFDSAFLQPQGRRSGRSSEMYAVDNAQERAERRHLLRRHSTRQPQPAPAAREPVLPADHVYGSSPHYGSSWGSSATAHSGGGSYPQHVSPSPAAEAVKKELRWEDQLRAEQNARIRARPMQTATAPLAPRGILKNPAPAEVEEEEHRRSRADLDDLYKSLRGLSMEEREARRRARRRGEEKEEKEDKVLDRDYTDRLRSRFELPTRRFSVSGGKSRPAVFFSDEGRYMY